MISNITHSFLKSFKLEVIFSTSAIIWFYEEDQIHLYDTKKSVTIPVIKGKEKNCG